MERIDVIPGVSVVDIPEADLSVLCGCPADIVKHLMRRGLILRKETGGVAYESGPNAILLSDVSVQNGAFSNLAEFPVLQMLYRQGMLLPGHPRNTGRKPMIIGLEEQVRAQSVYIHCGNYGLPSVEAIESAGLSPEAARDVWRMKLRFAFDRIRSTEDLVDFRVVDRDVIRIAPEVRLRRLATNRYQFIHGAQTVEVDLNLAPTAVYEPPFRLGYHPIVREYFSVIHIGEGDGWDSDRPCMSSIVLFQGRIYLIDAGPNILGSLVALGICVNELAGLFHTHAHDDHFAGLPSLARSGNRLRYFAAPLVRKTAQRKFAALLDIPEDRFGDYFETRDLDMDGWNDVEGLEVRPVLTPHPVETTNLLFRTTWEGGYRRYTHLADLVSFDVLRKMIAEDRSSSGVSREAAERYMEVCRSPADLKKLDVGGGLIHGRAADFSGDTSGKLVLSHKAGELTDEEKQIGSNATFGMHDILIRAQQDYTMQSAHHYLRVHLPGVSDSDLAMLLNGQTEEHNVGLILVKKGSVSMHVHLVLSGVVEFLDSPTGVHNILATGSLVGELCAITGAPSTRTYRTASYVKTLRMPAELYVRVLTKSGVLEHIREVRERRHLLENTWLLGEMIPFGAQDSMARRMTRRSLRAGEAVRPDGRAVLSLLEEGLMELVSGRRVVENVGFGGFWGEENVLGAGPSIFQARAAARATVWEIPAEVIAGIPIVRLKLQETLERRRRSFAGSFDFEWDETYSVGDAEIDRQHAELFAATASVERQMETADPAELRRKVEDLLAQARRHFASEEEILGRIGYPEIERQRAEHRSFLARVEKMPDLSGAGPGDLYPHIALARDWIVTHTLIEDRKYLAALGGASTPRR
jgi:hemerythrin